MTIGQKKVLVLDIDGTLCEKKGDKSYLELKPIKEVVDKVNSYKANGFSIVLHTSRNMRTYDGNIGKINANTLKDLFKWLDQNDICYDEIHVGKPWAGTEGFYVDDRAIRPNEFVNLNYDQIKKLTSE